MIFSPICRFTGYSGGFICFCDYLHQGIYGNLWTTCSKRKVLRPHSPFGKRKTREKILRVKIRAQVRKEVFVTGVQLEIAETFNSFNATLLHSQAEFFFFWNFFLVWKHNIVYSKTLLQDKKTFSVFMIASDPTPPLDKYFVQQIHQDLHLPLP